MTSAWGKSYDQFGTFAGKKKRRKRSRRRRRRGNGREGGGGGTGGEGKSLLSHVYPTTFLPAGCGSISRRHVIRAPRHPSAAVVAAALAPTSPSLSLSLFVASIQWPCWTKITLVRRSLAVYARAECSLQRGTFQSWWWREEVGLPTYLPTWCSTLADSVKVHRVFRA